MQWRLILLEKAQFWLFCLTIVYIYYVWTRRKVYLLSWQLPGPVAFPLIGNACLILQGGATQFVSHGMRLISRAPCRLVRVWNVASEMVVLIGDADVVFQVNKMPQKPELYRHFGGQEVTKGLVTDTDVDHWRWARKLCQPSFSLENLKATLKIFHSESLNTAHAFDRLATSGESFNGEKLTAYYSFYSSMRFTFDDERRLDAVEYDTFHRCLEEMFEHFQRKLIVKMFRNSFVYGLFGLLQKERFAKKTLRGFIQGLIDFNKKKLKGQLNPPSGKAFINQIMDVDGVTDEELISQAVTLLVAALDTTKIENTAVLLMLALHPHIQNELHKEVIEVLGDDVAQIPPYEDLMKLNYLDRIIKECMRIFPSVPVVGKKAYKDMKVVASDGEYTIPAGTLMAILICSIHKNPYYYDNPEQFDPDRWLPERMTVRNPHCFLPFSSGPRNCLGAKYANLQMKMFAVTMVRLYHILPSETCRTLEDVKYEMLATLKFKENCKIKLRRRGVKVVS